MEKNDFAKANTQQAKHRRMWVTAGMTALTVGASVAGPEILDEVQTELGNNEPRTTVTKDSSPLVKVGNVLFSSRTAAAETINNVVDANGGNHSFKSTQTQVTTKFTGSGTGFSNASGSYDGQSATFTTLTAGNGSDQGAIAFNKQLDMTASWTLKFNMNLTKYNTGGAMLGGSSNGAGDFLGLVLAPIAPNKLGTSGAGGGALGIGTDANAAGIPNAVQWGIDFYQNDGDATNLVNPTDGTLISSGSDGNQVAGFRTTDSAGKLNTVSGSTGFTAFTKSNGESIMGFDSTYSPSATDSKWQGASNPNYEAPMTATYTYANGVGTLTIKADDGSYTASKQITITDGVNSTMSVGFKASDGTKYSQKGVTIREFDLTLPTADTKVNYIDKEGNAISGQASTTIKSNVNDTLGIVTSGAATNTTGTAHTFTAPTIAGYTYTGTTYGTAKSTTGPLTVSDTDANNIINVQYAKKSKITTVFVDQNGHVLSTVPSVELGTAGTNYDGQKATDAADYADYTAALATAKSNGYTGVSGVYSDSALTTKLGADLSAATFGNADKTVYVQLTPAPQTATITYNKATGLSTAGSTAQDNAVSASPTSLTGVTNDKYPANTIQVPAGMTATIKDAAGNTLDTDTSKVTHLVKNSDGSYTIVGAFNLTSAGALAVPSYTVTYTANAVKMIQQYPDETRSNAGTAYGTYSAAGVVQKSGYVSFVDGTKANQTPAGTFDATDKTYTITYEAVPATAGEVANEPTVTAALAAVTAATTETDYKAALAAYNTAVSDAQTARDNAETAAKAVDSSGFSTVTAVSDAQTNLNNVLAQAAAGQATTQQVIDATTALQTAISDAQAALDAAKAQAKTDIQANIDDINTQITQIQADIDAIQALADHNPGDTTIAGLLADAQQRLANAQSQLTQAEAALAAVDSAATIADVTNLSDGADQNQAAADSARTIADQDLAAAQAQDALNLKNAKDEATATAETTTTANQAAIQQIEQNIAELQQLAEDYPNNATIATQLINAQDALDAANKAQADVDTASGEVPGLTTVEAVQIQQAAVNAAGKDAQNMLVVANDAVTAAKAEAKKVLSDAKAAATSAIQQQLDDADANIQTIKDNIAAIQTLLDNNPGDANIQTIKDNIAAIQTLLDNNPGDADIQAALDDANAQLVTANNQLADMAEAYADATDATTPAEVQAARDAATAAATAITDATTQSTTDLTTAQAKSDANLAAAKASAETTIGDQLDQVGDDIAAIQDDITALTQIAADNPTNTEIAAKLADAKAQLATAQTQESDLKDTKAAIDAATTLAGVSALEESATTAATTSTTAKTAADQDLTDAQALAAADLQAAQTAATTTIQGNIDAIQDQVDQITQDIATIETLATNNPGDTVIADALSDAKQQLADAQRALTDAQAQQTAVADATTPAAVQAVVDVAATDQTTAETAGTTSTQDVATAQRQNDANLATAQAAAKDALQDNIDEINDAIAQIATDVATLQTLADNNPSDQTIADKLADALTQQQTAQDALTDAQTQLTNVDQTTTLAQVDALTTQGQADEDAAKAAAEAVNTDVTTAQNQSATNLADAKETAKDTIQANIDQITSDGTAIDNIIAELTDLVTNNPGDTTIADALQTAQDEKAKQADALKDSQAQLAQVDEQTTLADVADLVDQAGTNQGTADQTVVDASQALDAANAQSADNLADAKTAAKTTITSDLTDIQDNIDGIQDNIADLQQLVTDNPTNTQIADKLADAQQQLTDAQAEKQAAQDTLDAVDNQTTLADVQAQTDAAGQAVVNSDGDATQAQTDLDEAQTLANADLAADQAAAQKAVDDQIAQITDDIAAITDDVATLQEIATNNPDDATIADKLADAQAQQQAAETALTEAQNQKTAIDNATTPAEVTAAQTTAETAGQTASDAKDAADQDVTDAQAKSDANLAAAKTAADTALDQNIANITDDVAAIQDIVDELQTLADNNPDDTEIADKLADAQTQLTTANDALTDAQNQKTAVADATTLADVQTAVDAGQADEDAAQTALENAQADQTAAQAKSDSNLDDAQQAAKDAITQDLATITDNVAAIQADVAALEQIATDNPTNQLIQDKLADAQRQLTDAQTAQTNAEQALDAVTQATTPAEVAAQEQIVTEAVTNQID
ncbi:lectin-like domain-containing protein [Weissella cibaria]|uniref:Gram-positive cocci surface proteins LPxTG domain-containing protein n=1 Tax=Weissella cibaria TaxID=137591 RepID=A0A0D1JJL2_9LACO|nr:hypothetical protein [Weissella cibaria]KIU21578.1 hypothetical protein QX99_00656 [Weissella cibaria]MDV8930136.1 hypothetical protein [Weissella cibaria]